jgi:segregation and condensation protein B
MNKESKEAMTEKLPENLPDNSKKEIDDRLAEQIVEALIFSTEEPLSTAKIREVVPEIQSQQIPQIVDRLNTQYAQSGRSFEIQNVAGGYLFYTRPDFSEYLQRFHFKRLQSRLSSKALETLAIIAYKQPVTRTEIEEIRGVNADGVLRTLLSRNLITIAGTADVPGNPYLYKTTRQFLEYFGLKDIKDLPRLKELDEIVAADSDIKERFGETFLKEISPELLGIEAFDTINNNDEENSSNQAENESDDKKPSE